jgi:hypothetical protein
MAGYVHLRGLIASPIGIVTLLIPPGTPMRAKFLTGSEKTALLSHLAIKQLGIQSHYFQLSQLE